MTKTQEEIRKAFEEKGYTSWINSDIYPDGRIYTKEYTEYLERKILDLQTNSIESLIDRNYNAQIRRGQINDKTEPHNFLTKINEELEEVMQSDTWEEMADEVNDLKMVCESYLKYLY